MGKTFDFYLVIEGTIRQATAYIVSVLESIEIKARINILGQFLGEWPPSATSLVLRGMHRLLGLFLLALLALSGLNTYAQTADMTQGCFPLTVQFTAPAGSTSWFWNFDDGASSNQQNPTNTFLAAGNYNVTFSATQGGPVLGTIAINVYPKPTPTFTADPTSGCVPLAVQFTNTTTAGAGINITGYNWVFGDGGLATGPNPTRTFVQPGSHFVSLAITTNMPSCNVTQVYPDFIEAIAQPLASFTISPFPAVACNPPLTVNVTNTSETGNGISYNWNFGNGSTSTSQNPASVTYTNNGNFTIGLQVSNQAGCVGTVSQTVSIGSPITAFTMPDTICFPGTVNFTNQSSPGTYQWSFGPGSSPSSSFQPQPMVTFNQAGIIPVTLTTTSGNCSSSLTQNLFVEDPSAEFTSLPDYSCSTPYAVNFVPVNPGYEIYSWMFGDSITSSSVSPTHVYQNLDTNRYTWDNQGQHLVTWLAIESSAGCRDTVWHIDTLWQPYAVFFPSVIHGCAPLTVVYSDSSTAGSPLNYWEWHLGNGQVITQNTSNPQTVTYTQPGHYSTYLIVRDVQGCIDTSYNVVVEVGTEIPLQFSVSPNTVCPGEEVQFTNLTALADSVDAWHYYSESDHQFHCFQNDNPTWAYQNLTGPMDVTLMAEFNGCISTATVANAVTVNGPIAELYYNTSCTTPNTVVFEDRSHDATSILWDFGDGTTSTQANPTHTYAASGDYTVILRAENANTGCPPSFDTAVVHIRNIHAEFTGSSLICQNAPTPFTGVASVDVHNVCWGGYTWQFDHPNMRPITTTNPEHPIVFPYPGYVGVSLIVRDINGCTDTATADVRVFGLDAQFSVDPTICPGQQVLFTNQSTSDTTVAGYSWWQWSTGSPFSTAISPTQEYPTFQTDTIHVQLTVTSVIGCTDTISHYMTMYQPVSFVTPMLANVCAGASVTFSATNYTQGGSNLSFNWNFADGTPNGTNQNPSHVFANAGTFNVVMTYTETGSGCTGTVSPTVNVQDYPLASYSSNPESSGVFCSPSNVSFTSTTTGQGPFTNVWSLGSGPNLFGQTVGSVFTSGTYTVTLISSTSYGCADTASTTYNVIGPQGTFTLENNTICRGESLTFTITDSSEVYLYVWDFGDGQTAVNQSPVTHTYTYVPPNGQTVAKLVVSGPSGECTMETSVDIFIHEVVARFERNFGGDTALCFQPYSLTNQSLNANVYGWDFGDGTTFTGPNPPIHNYPGPGTYTVTLGVMNSTLGCTDTMIKQVVLYPIPEIEARGDTVCEGDQGQLAVLNPIDWYNYTWSQPVAVTDPTAPTTFSTPFLTTEFEVTVVDTNQCTNSSLATIHVVNPLNLAGLDTTIVVGDSICIGPNVDPSLYYFMWTPSEGLTCDTCNRPCLQPLVPASYNLSVSDVLGCFTTDADYIIDIHPETFIAMPTTFTPNGDGNNDVIYVEGWGIKQLLEFRIFNRWGEEIFLSQDEEHGWDGHYKGVLQNNDVYAYVVKVLTWRDEVKTLEGYINLMR